MITKFNKDNTVTISQMPKDLYWAVVSILGSARRTFEWQEDENEYWSNSDFVCSLSPEEKEALDDENWSL